MLDSREKQRIGILIGVTALVVAIVFAIHGVYQWTDIDNQYAIIIEIMVGVIIAYIAISRTDKDTTLMKGLINKINEYEEKQKQFLDELEKTRTARINFYGTKLVTDFTTIEKYFTNVESIPKEQISRLTSEFFFRNDVVHVIHFEFDDKWVEIPNRQFFSMMKQDLQIIESDLPPEISYFVGTVIEMTQMTFVPIVGTVSTDDKLWNDGKINIKTAIERLNSVITEKKPLKDYGVLFIRSSANIRFKDQKPTER